MGTMDVMAVKTVRRKDEKRQKPEPAPRLTRRTTQSVAAKVARDIFHNQPSKDNLTWGSETILSYYVEKPEIDGETIVANLVYTTYEKGGEEEYNVPFKFAKSELMQCVPTKNASARLKMLHETLLVKEARQAEVQEYLKEFLDRHARENWSQKCDSLKRELNSPRTNFRPKLKNMVRFEVLYSILINPRLY